MIHAVCAGARASSERPRLASSASQAVQPNKDVQRRTRAGPSWILEHVSHHHPVLATFSPALLSDNHVAQASSLH